MGSEDVSQGNVEAQKRTSFWREANKGVYFTFLYCAFLYCVPFSLPFILSSFLFSNIVLFIPTTYSSLTLPTIIVNNIRLLHVLFFFPSFAFFYSSSLLPSCPSSTSSSSSTSLFSLRIHQVRLTHPPLRLTPSRPLSPLPSPQLRFTILILLFTFLLFLLILLFLILFFIIVLLLITLPFLFLLHVLAPATLPP